MAQEGPIASATVAAGAVGTTQLANDAVTYAKIQNVSATDKLLGRSTAGAGDVEEVACTAAGRALIDDADASAQRATLGLGTAALVNTGTGNADVPTIAQADARYQAAGGGSVVRYQPAMWWPKSNINANQAETIIVTTPVTGFSAWQPPRSGSVVAITAQFNDAITVGTISIGISISGAAANVNKAVFTATGAYGGTVTFTPGDIPYDASIVDTVSITTESSAALLPTGTLDMVIWIQVQDT